ncbi:MAG: hypothetical protein WDW38_003059 [Sanguina aurantia]
MAIPAEMASKRRVLFDISGRVVPGKVLALMGPSGSGKTSLLSCIGGRIPKQIDVVGEVLINGQLFTKATRRRIGFVMQDDVLYETLTVYETLQFVALLRLPSQMARAKKLARVEAVIDVLGLQKSRGTIIGGFFRRGISADFNTMFARPGTLSGGEQQMLAMARAVMLNPEVILLDEPSMGLDSTTAMRLVTLLHDLARGGRALLTTIHQPSSRIYRQLDQVMLLAEGHVMYAGDAMKVIDWFDHMGFHLPYGVNIADFILDCATGEASFGDLDEAAAVRSSTRGSHRGTSRAAPSAGLTRRGSGTLQLLSGGGDAPSGDLDDAPKPSRAPGLKASGAQQEVLSGPAALLALYQTFESWYLVHPAGFQSGSGLERVKLLTKDQSHSALDTITPPQGTFTQGSHALHQPDGDGPQDPVDQGKKSPPVSASVAADLNQRQGATYWEQLVILSARTVKVRRFESLSGQNIAQLLGVAIVTGLLWWQRGRSQTLSAAVDVQGLLFFELLFPSFRSLFAALFTFPSEYRILAKERPSGMYRLSSYYLSRTAADLPLEVLFPVVFSAIVYWFGGLRLSGGAFIANMLILILVTLIAQSWGLLFGGSFMDPKLAQTVTTVVMLTFLLIGGFYVRSIPVWIGWIKYLSFIYWGSNLLLKTQFGHNQYFDCTAPGSISGSASQDSGPCVPISNLQESLRLPIDPDSSVWLDTVVLLAMLFFLRIITYYVLRVKTEDRGAIGGARARK